VARLALNKSSLQRQRTELEKYERYLPSLDLKRRQLMAERASAVESLSKTEKELERLRAEIPEKIPMLSNREVDLTGLVRVTNVEQDIENRVGVKLPRLKSVDIEVKDYARLGRPHWVDMVARHLRRCVELALQIQFERRRLDLLQVAVKQITQRVNLFDKVLIPKTRRNIKRIEIYLGDAERAGVVQAKVAKKKRLMEGAP
jgi:V/A-type H+-transporting ATPase subunit D